MSVLSLGMRSTIAPRSLHQPNGQDFSLALSLFETFPLSLLS